MFGSTSRRSTRRTHHTTTTTTPRSHRGGFFSRRPARDRQAAGYKAAMNNPNTTHSGRKHAKHELEAMGRGREAHTSLSTRVRHWLHLGGRNKNRRARY